MSNKSRLEANNASLQAIMNKVNALPDVGSGGSGVGSVETCTIKIIVHGYLNALSYVNCGSLLTYINGEYIPQYIQFDCEYNNSRSEFTIEHVVCPQEIGFYIHPSGTYYIYDISMDGDISFVDPEFDSEWSTAGRGLYLHAKQGDVVILEAYIDEE